MLKVAAVDKVSYRDALMKVKSGAGVSQRPVRGETTAAAAGPRTSTPLPTAVPSTTTDSLTCHNFCCRIMAEGGERPPLMGFSAIKMEFFDKIDNVSGSNIILH